MKLSASQKKVLQAVADGWLLQSPHSHRGGKSWLLTNDVVAPGQEKWVSAKVVEPMLPRWERRDDVSHLVDPGLIRIQSYPNDIMSVLTEKGRAVLETMTRRSR
jgi:hypothetical protein